MSAAVRLDFSPVRLGATPIDVRPDGYRVYRGIATYGDVVLEYPEFGRNEFRPAAEVLSPEAVRSMRGVPFTLHHPEDLLDAEDPDSIRRHQVGTVLDAVADLAANPPSLVVEVIVHSRPAQEAIESGELAELSPGYRCEDEPAPPGAKHGGKPYSVVQRQHRNNHLSGVLAARTVLPDGRRARLDEMRAADTTYPPKESTPMTIAATAAALANLAADPGGTRTDAADPAIVLAKFTPGDAEILKTLSPEGLMMLAEMGAGAMAVSDPGMPPVDVEIDDASAKPPGGVTMDMVTAAINDAFAKMGKKTDAAPQPDAAAAGAVRIDAESVIARATEEARKSVRRDAAIVDAVRRDGHADVTGYESAVTKMLSIVEQHAPRLLARAREDLKAGRMDAVTAAYETAEDRRRESTVSAQAEMLRPVFDHDDGQRQPIDTFRMPVRG